MTHDAFLQAIIESADDDTVRLIYADFLDENGDSARAEFIRLSCSLAKLDENDPRRNELGTRHRDLLKEHERDWSGPLTDLAQKCWFVRGFVERIEIHAATLLRHAEAIFGFAPVQEIRLLGAEGLTAGLAACSHLRRVTALDLHCNSLGDDGLRELLASPYRKHPSTYLGCLRKLNLGNTGISQIGLNYLLARSQLFPDLVELDLAGNQFGDEVVEALAGSPLSARLRKLDLSWCLSAAGVHALATSFAFGELRSLHLFCCHADDTACEALATSTTLPMLTDLWLGGSFLRPNNTTAAGIQALVHSSKSSRLKALHLDGSGIGDAGVEVLASSRELRELRWLSLDENGISDQGVRALIRSPFWPNLHWLGLSRNPFGNAGAQEFLSAPLPTRLFCLFLMHCQVTAPLEKELRERFGTRVHI
jgi:uncharacterized protein (TIGR02996 family)